MSSHHHPDFTPPRPMASNPIRAVREAAALAAAEVSTGFPGSMLLRAQIVAVAGLSDAALIAGLREIFEVGHPSLGAVLSHLAEAIEDQAREDQVDG